METANITPANERLLRALAELNSFAHKNDVRQSVIDLNMSEGTIRRYLRGIIHDWGTAQELHDHLRNLTIKRSHGILDKLEQSHQAMNAPVNA